MNLLWSRFAQLFCLFVYLLVCFGYNAFLSLLIQLKNVTALDKRSFEFKIAVAR